MTEAHQPDEPEATGTSDDLFDRWLAHRTQQSGAGAGDASAAADTDDNPMHRQTPGFEPVITPSMRRKLDQEAQARKGRARRSHRGTADPDEQPVVESPAPAADVVATDPTTEASSPDTTSSGEESVPARRASRSTSGQAPEWLQDLRAADEAPAEPPAGGDGPAADVPVWAAGFTPLSIPAPDPEDDLPDWMSAAAEDAAPAAPAAVPVAAGLAAPARPEVKPMVEPVVEPVVEPEAAPTADADPAPPRKDPSDWVTRMRGRTPPATAPVPVDAPTPVPPVPAAPAPTAPEDPAEPVAEQVAERSEAPPEQDWKARFRRAVTSAAPVAAAPAAPAAPAPATLPVDEPRPTAPVEPEPEAVRSAEPEPSEEAAPAASATPVADPEPLLAPDPEPSPEPEPAAVPDPQPVPAPERDTQPEAPTGPTPEPAPEPTPEPTPEVPDPPAGAEAAKAETPAPAPGDHKFRTRRGARLLAGLLLLAGVAVTVYLGREAYLAPDQASIALTAVAAFTTAVVSAIRSSTVVTRVAIRDGSLVVTRDGTRTTYDLGSDPSPVELVGSPGRRGWKAVLTNRGAPPVELTSSDVDPRRFSQVVGRHLEHGRSQTEIQ